MLPNHEISRYKWNEAGETVLKEAGVCCDIRSPVISSDGDVFPCCFDLFGQHRQGNAVQDSFFKIWNRRSYRLFRKKMMRERKLEMCSACAYRDMPVRNVRIASS